jgi:hypothetical protein
MDEVLTAAEAFKIQKDLRSKMVTDEKEEKYYGMLRNITKLKYDDHYVFNFITWNNADTAQTFEPADKLKFKEKPPSTEEAPRRSKKHEQPSTGGKKNKRKKNKGKTTKRKSRKFRRILDLIY